MKEKRQCLTGMRHLSRKEQAMIDAHAALEQIIQQQIGAVRAGGSADIQAITDADRRLSEARAMDHEYECLKCRAIFDPLETRHIVVTCWSITDLNGDVYHQMPQDTAKLALCETCVNEMEFFAYMEKK